MQDTNNENNKSKKAAEPVEGQSSGEYRSILADDDGSAKPIRRKKKDPMEKVRREIEEQQRQQREKAELLKLRQGIIDESEEIPEDAPPQYEKPKGKKAIENFFYHYKWRVAGITFVVALATFLTVQLLTREKRDLYVLAISTSNSSGIYMKTSDIETALERYCPDFDGNGYVHVAVNYINLSDESGMSEYYDSNNLKFTSELMAGDSQLYLTDTGIISLINTIAADDGTTTEAADDAGTGEEGLAIRFFTDFTEEYPDAELYCGCGLQLNTTGFIDEARWQSCPDEVGLYLREEFSSNMTGNDSDAQEQRRRARIVYENIISNNVVNPDWQGS